MRAEDILNALDHVDPALVGAADRKPRLWPKRLRRFAAAAACTIIFSYVSIFSLVRLS